MKKLFTLGFIVSIISIASAQLVPVTFHFKPDYTQFTTLRIAGTFNNWNNADPAMEMKDPDGDGEYDLTIDLAKDLDHNYKFVMDANWGFAYTDPDNPVINILDNNNSTLHVKDPLITYLLPRDINSKSEKFIDVTPTGLPIRAIFAFTQANPIDPNTLQVIIDGVPLSNPSQYYDAQKREFKYQPNPALTIGDHTVIVSITSALGTDERTSTFRRDPNYKVYNVPVDFYFDQNNTSVVFSQKVTDVVVTGTFNNWNDVFNPMRDPDGDGLWEATATITPDKYEYKFKLNKIIWVNDPDEPAIGTSADQNSLVVVVADSIPKIKLVQPLEGTIFSENPANVSFKALLRPGVKSSGIVDGSIITKLDGTNIPNSFDTTTSTVTSTMILNGEGRHIVEVSFTNKEGLSASEIYSYGIYTNPKGKYIVDALNDEPYSYPAGVPNGSADILSAKITDTPTHDSLKFAIQLKDVTDRTRIGLIITSPSSTLASDPLGLDIRTPNWNGQGIFASIGAPGNLFENPITENRIMVSNNPVTYSNYYLNINNDALTKDEFDFTISLSFLDSIIGSWTRDRQFMVFSFIAADDKSGKGFEVGVNEGGTSTSEDPNIYDAAFIRSGFWQKRMFKNFIPVGQPNGPRFVTLDGKGRGILSVTSNEISDSLAKFGTDISFLTPGVEYWYPDVTVHGELSDLSISTITFYFNNAPSTQQVTAGKFDVPLTLKEGENIVYVVAEDSKGFKSTSKNLIMNYKPDTEPSIAIDGTVTGRQVKLTANVTSPIGAQFTYLWSADQLNPANVFLSSTQKEVTINIPQTDGEYYFNLRVRDSKNNRIYVRKLVLAQGDSILLPEINHHPKWVDDAIVYEIYPRSFTQQGGFSGVVERIPEMKALGVNTIWFMPIYTGPTTHGYEITDYYGFEEDYGTEADFRAMMTALKANGFKVILDYVVNHTSIQHPFMQNVFQYKEYSPWANFYIWDGEPGNSNYQFLFDWSSLPNLNHQNPDVRKYFIKAAKYWVSNFNIDGFRCDVAWGVEQRNNLFWQEWREALKTIKPDIFLEAEASSAEAVFYQNRFDSANDWELRNKLLGALNGSVTIQSLHQEATRVYPEYARPFRFLENHDEVRVASSFDTKRSVLLHTIIFTLNGVPLIYSGGEVGEITRREMINWSDPDNVKPYFKKLTQIRSKYIHDPKIELIDNTDNNNVYSYSSISGNNVVLTAANFRNELKNTNMDLSKLPYDGSSNYYLTDLIDGKVYKVTPEQRTAFLISLNEYQAKVFYYGLDSVTVVDVENFADTKIPSQYKLFQNYPNPFNPVSMIKYQIKETEKVTLKIYDMLGGEVATLVDEFKSPGTYYAQFNGANLSSGIYFYQLKSGKYLETKKLVLLK
ncbi:MAG: alpha-amylase family glycosyl hydrolase [Ignavibacteriales bacterium]|nr:alpha-amylase family glycosyl hydrolase [Ignavibacteriales bacterium]